MLNFHNDLTPWWSGEPSQSVAGPSPVWDPATMLNLHEIHITKWWNSIRWWKSIRKKEYSPGFMAHCPGQWPSPSTHHIFFWPLTNVPDNSNQSCHSTDFFCSPHDLQQPALSHEISLASKEQVWEGLVKERHIVKVCPHLSGVREALKNRRVPTLVAAAWLSHCCGNYKSKFSLMIWRIHFQAINK